MTTNDVPVRAEINCAAWTANNLAAEAEKARDEARAADEAGRADEAEAHRGRARALDAMARRTLAEGGLDPDAAIEAVRMVPLTDDEIAQRAIDAEAGRGQALAMVRSHRDALLMRSDWTQIPGAKLNADEVRAWEAYRQALRDVPAQADPLNPTWPTPPG